MSPPGRYLTRMSLFALAVVLVAVILSSGLSGAFMANPLLNGVIIALMVVGIGYTFRLVLSLRVEVDWIEHLRAKQPRPRTGMAEPRLLAPLVSMLSDQRGSVTISALSMRSVLDGIGSRMGEGREITRYLIGLLIFLGLLGTFWGLLQTIAAVASVIRDLSVDTGDLSIIFADLQDGLQAPLTGMGTAFSSSLFGLAGSLILGFFELQSSQAQNRFYNELEDWLSGAVKLSAGGTGLDGEGQTSLPSYMRALVEQTAENMQSMQAAISALESRHRQTGDTMAAMAEQLTSLNANLHDQHRAALKAADTQAALQPALTRLNDTLAAQEIGLDADSREQIRMMNARLGQLLSNQGQNLDKLSLEVRNEIKVLTRTIAAVAEAEIQAHVDGEGQP